MQIGVRCICHAPDTLGAVKFGGQMTEIHFQSTAHVRLWQTCMKIRKYQGGRELGEYELLRRSVRDISFSPPRALFLTHLQWGL